VPVISYFFGIYVRMYYADHLPAHFHVEYQSQEAFISIETGEVLQSKLPGKAARIVKEWALEYQQELMTNWRKAFNLEP
jgi:Domain of unknown function (DUF4160)